MKIDLTVNKIPEEQVTIEIPKRERKPRIIRLDDCLGNYGKPIIDKAGYIPAKEQIDNFKRAGINLENYRREMYSNVAVDDNNVEINFTAQKGFDEFQAHEMMKDVNNTLRNAYEKKEPGQKEPDDKASPEVKAPEKSPE